MPYDITKIADDIYAFDEGGVRSFLILGENENMLVDTCYGKDNIKAACEKYSDKPIFVVNTHADPDHIGGNARFDRIYMNEAEKEYYLRSGTAQAVSYISEADRFCAGSHIFEVIHIPGHTPGSIALLDKNSRLLIGGDSVQTGAIFMFGPGRSMTDYIASMKKLRERRDDFDTVLASHAELYVSPDMIDCLIDGAENVLAGNCTVTDPPIASIPAKVCSSGKAKFLYMP